MANIGAKVEGNLLTRLRDVETRLYDPPHNLRAGGSEGKLARTSIALQAIEEWIGRMEINLVDPEWKTSLSSENCALRDAETKVICLRSDARRTFYDLLPQIIGALGVADGPDRLRNVLGQMLPGIVGDLGGGGKKSGQTPTSIDREGGPNPRSGRG